ncbi:hypothetical protein LPJ77_000375 [Coemansia sp. RSA 2523]|nr:hypothetical protein LPJ69_000744 [Coemansia sp. RSA 1752]KAJ1793910.1 hypothetical protein LPJ67_001095 [Coemansia sp. RSA 1938]KAJ1811078.1 hypothetical protein LPJ77_000375 [Coemansia sp. RSA 2523]KAJ2145738.1 hypothetical protein IW142_002450 [Coemansia sp. RSA 564]KAJ2212725.1 Cytochrome c oxidase subunit 7A [Coemansia sp. RSA 520]KAJ2242759.1 hypothetical protein GGH98_005287 [Coemansia sp. RSA 454]KAJ2410803.1 hypothetical protein J3F80_000304 [Coemansia sp. RSA 2526]KAJ2435189.1 C
MPSATPLKPITGIIRRRIVRDLAIGLGSGYVVAEVYWYYFMKGRKREEDYYAKMGGRLSQRR